jgi:membrane-associated phospholipid phosphatase
MKTTELTLRYALDNHVRDAVPKRKELPRFRAPLIQPTASQWQADAKHAQAMERLLHSYGFEHVELGYDAKHTLSLTLSHPTQLHTSSAVGDAVHIALKAGPSDTKEIALRYLNGETQLAIAQYHFTDISALNAYVKGQIRQSALWPSVRVSDPAVQEASDIKIRAPKSEGEVSQMLTSLGQSAQQTRVHLTQAPDQTFVRQAIDLTSPNSLDDLGLKPRNEGSNWALSPLGLNWNSGGDRDHRVSIYPKLATYLNGPAIFQYSLKLGMQYEGKLADKTYASVIMTKPVVEDIVKLGIGNPKSKLPNVRSRTAFYEANQDVRLDRAVINRFEQLDQNVYGRVNLGFFETAYAGVGAQVLWTPKDVAWAADISIDALAQRDEKQMFASNGYRTLTALASVHYRLPMDVLLTARAGQFLAKDRGVRVEFMRRFWGGIEVGAWASVTNAKDYAFAPGSNYRDKGLAINIPFDSLLENYSRQKASITMQPWTRDAGQMVRNPADLYELLEDDIRSKRVQSGLERFSGVSDYDGQVKMGALGFDEGIVSPAINATRRFATEMRQADLICMATSGALFTLSAALSDRSLNKWSNKSSPALQTRFNQLGSATSGLTALGLGAAALWAYDGQDWQRSQVALASLEASGAAIVMATGLKYLTARARPSEGLGASSFGNVPRGSSSFLSRHVALASAMVTPLAIHYDAPLLYALPALTALARVGTRKHWASDVAAGGALGFALGNLFYQSHTRADKQRNPVMFNLTKESISITIPTE